MKHYSEQHVLISHSILTSFKCPVSKPSAVWMQNIQGQKSLLWIRESRGRRNTLKRTQAPTQWVWNRLFTCTNGSKRNKMNEDLPLPSQHLLQNNLYNKQYLAGEKRQCLWWLTHTDPVLPSSSHTTASSEAAGLFHKPQSAGSMCFHTSSTEDRLHGHGLTWATFPSDSAPPFHRRHQLLKWGNIWWHATSHRLCNNFQGKQQRMKGPRFVLLSNTYQWLRINAVSLRSSSLLWGYTTCVCICEGQQWMSAIFLVFWNHLSPNLGAHWFSPWDFATLTPQ